MKAVITKFSRDVRVRFAPSPTDALKPNYASMRRNHSKFIENFLYSFHHSVYEFYVEKGYKTNQEHVDPNKLRPLSLKQVFFTNHATSNDTDSLKAGIWASFINKKYNLSSTEEECSVHFLINVIKEIFDRIVNVISCEGYLHLGGLRTALFNFLFAHSNNGKFILRLEDTDRTRLVPHAMEQLEYDLKWVGLIPDEGPSCGGKFGPYVQSQRYHIYKDFALKLLESKAAYYCFCSERRLELIRKNAIRNRQIPKYDNKCRNLGHEEIMSKLKSGIEKCVRFKLVPSEPFNDLIYGIVQHEVQDLEGDPVLLKADGWPTYHLANVVDDHLMNISHVIRGVEWLLSTNKHLMIYRALGCEPPVFAHLPLILNADGTKLSKRQNDITVKSMRSKGVFPRTLINFVIQAGGGFTEKVDPNSSLEDLVSKFNLRELNKHSGKLPHDRLGEFNRLEIARRCKNKTELSTLVNEVKTIVMNNFNDRYTAEELDLNEEHVKLVLQWSLPRINYLNDLVGKDMEFLWVRPNLKQYEARCDPEILSTLEKELMKVDFNKEKLITLLKSFSKENKIPFKELMGFLRMSLSGLKQGPGVAEMMEILGKSASLKRLEEAKNSVISFK